MSDGRADSGSTFRAPISVVVPCYRCKATLRRAIASVAGQSTRPAEIVLVDDGSDDDTLGLLMDVQREFGENWVKVIALGKNRGPSDARNAGWAAASGKYIAFLDADDAWHPRKLEIQHAFMETHPEVALCGHFHRRLSNGDDLDTPLNRPGFRIISLWALLLSNRFHPTSVIVRRDVPLRFASGRRHMEDHLLWIQIASEGRQIARLSEVLSFTFKSPLGTSGLSAHTWQMRRGELANYWALHGSGRLGVAATLALSAYSLAKHLIRSLLLVAWREPPKNR